MRCTEKEAKKWCADSPAGSERGGKYHTAWHKKK